MTADVHRAGQSGDVGGVGEDADRQGGVFEELQPDLPEDDGSSRISFYLEEDEADASEILEKVRQALDDANIDFTIVYPRIDCKDEWVGRCYIREKNGESGCGAEIMNTNWEKWISECIGTGRNHNEIVLRPRERLSDYFSK